MAAWEYKCWGFDSLKLLPVHDPSPCLLHDLPRTQPSHYRQLTRNHHITRASIGSQLTNTSQTSPATCKKPSLKMFFIAAIRNWRVDPRRVKDEAIRMLRILTGSI
ncbi:hypothetical protein B0H65DRAFT_432533 [Neurospora tetraspora]|uniref:Uncharacterized protein n=1 Tax=Neurospora tetraspora TaxID=94610 RepID=A0AAE0J8B4_9PEZI|nr:hypothetical protein B0H65DRAFT_432533 [Neurospora tetraspora]